MPIKAVAGLLGGAALLALVVFTSFQWGKSSCRAAQERANAEIRGQHAETVNSAERAATERALDAQERDLTNEQIVEDISEEAKSQPGASDVCITADVVERLRELQ